MTQKVTLKVGNSHAKDNAKCSDPLVAIEELIWNSLDSDAQVVSVTMERNALDAIETIHIDDDGEGIDFKDWLKAFGQLGDSLKLSKRTTASGRCVHGKSGKGRLKALGIGENVSWRSRFLEDGECKEFDIRGCRAQIRDFVSTDPQQAPAGAATGVSVEITNLDTGLGKLDKKDEVVNELSQKFCLYLSQYPGIAISYEGAKLDPETNKTHEEIYPLKVQVTASKEITAQLTIVEWSRSSERAIYLCDSRGFARDEVKTRIKKSTGWKFTAYLQSEYVDELESEGRLGATGLNESATAFVDAAHEAIANHFLKREADRADDLVEAWKSEKLYPYREPPQTPMEGVEQKVFDVCALNVNMFIKGFDSSSNSNKRLTFRLLREALAQNPTKLGRILREVVALPKAKQDELINLMDRAKLSAIISASNQVVGRLRFLDSLEDMIFGQLSKTLNEPRQLHRVLARELWLFGDQYNLGADEKGLRSVLVQHINILGRDQLVTDDVKLLDGKDARFDLMLWTQVPAIQNHVEHLVIELKRPTVKIGEEEITQIEKYAFKVANDSRFNKTDADWKFVLVGRELDAFADEKCKQADRVFGHIKSGNPGIYVKTWSSLIRDARYRYEFFKKELAMELSDDDGLAYLREQHGNFFSQDWSVPKKAPKLKPSASTNSP